MNHLHIDVVDEGDKERVKISAQGTDEEIIAMLIDGICAFSAKSQSGISAKEVIKIMSDELEAWE